jgi:hypothetical protein
LISLPHAAHPGRVCGEQLDLRKFGVHALDDPVYLDRLLAVPATRRVNTDGGLTFVAGKMSASG